MCVTTIETRERASTSTSRPAGSFEALEPVFNERASRKKREKQRNTERKRTRKGMEE